MDGGLVIADGAEMLLAICVYCFRDAVRGGLSVGRIPPRNAVSPEEAIDKLRALKDFAFDQEAAHQEADDILIVVLRTLAPDVAREYEVLRLEKGFWYA